jgi:hypothetical protein
MAGDMFSQGPRRSILAVKAVGGLFDRRLSNWLDASKFVVGENGQKEIYPGMVVAQNTSTYKWVPFSEAGSYGPGSDGENSKVGIMDTFEDVSWGDAAIAPLYHGKVIERHCYVFGGELGDIPAAVKTALPDMEWV